MSLYAITNNLGGVVYIIDSSGSEVKISSTAVVSLDAVGFQTAINLFGPNNVSLVPGGDSGTDLTTSGNSVSITNPLPTSNIVNGFPVSSSNPLPIAGSFSASIAGFAPNSVATPAVASTTSAHYALPSGTDVAFFNNGTIPVYINLGVSSSVVATTSDIPIQPSSWISLTVNSNIYVAVITATSTTTINMIGGSGILTGAGGGTSSGGGGGGGAVTIADGSDTTLGATTDGVWSGTGSSTLTQIMRAIWTKLTGSIAVTGTFYQATQPISGNITANAGTNLNTSSLALESGGNLATIAGTVSAGKVAITSADGALSTIGSKTDVANPATNSTSISAMSVWKQISASIQQFVFGPGSNTSALLTTLASNDPAVTTLGTPTGTKVTTDATGTIQQYLRGLIYQWTSGTLVLGSGSNIIGKFGIDQTTPGTTNLVALNPETTKVIGTVRIEGNAGGIFDASGQNASSPSNEVIVGGQFNTSPTTVTNGNVSPLQIDSSGNLKVNVVTGASSGTVNQGSTTSGQSGNLNQGAVTTANPTYISGQTDPLSLDTAGNLRVNVRAGIPVTGQTTASGSLPVVFNSDPDIRPSSGTITATDTASTINAGFEGASIYTGTPTTNSFYSQSINGQATALIQVSNIWTGSLQIEGSIDNGTTWGVIPAHVEGSSYTSSTLTANGRFIAPIAGNTNIRVRGISAITGSATITMVFSQQTSIVEIVNPMRIFDNTSGVQATIKPASTAAIATDTAIVVALSPNSVNSNGQATMANSAPVTIASNQSSIPVTVPVGQTTKSASTSVTIASDQGSLAVTVPVGRTTMSASTSVTLASDQPAIPVTVPVGQNVSASSTPVVIASDQSTLSTGGNVASGSTDSGNPIKVGGVANTSNPTAVTAGQRTNAFFDKVGKLITAQAPRSLIATSTVTLTGTGSNTLISALGANLFSDIVSIVVTNTSASSTSISYSDGSKTYYLASPANDTRGSNFTVPKPATSANTAWTIQAAASVNSLQIEVTYITNL